jgi:hypothetical protein
MRDSGYNESTFDLRGTVLISRFEEEVLAVAAVVDAGSWIEQSLLDSQSRNDQSLASYFPSRSWLAGCYARQDSSNLVEAVPYAC